MLLKNQELILDVLKHEENYEVQKELQNPFILPYVEKLTYDLITITGRKKPPKQSTALVPCLQKEIKITKNELKQLKEKQAQIIKGI